MGIQLQTRVTSGAKFTPGQTAHSVYLAIRPDQSAADEICLYFGDLTRGDWQAAAAQQLRDLLVAATAALTSIPGYVPPTPGPDDPTDDPTDEPVIVATEARRLVGMCPGCGHAPHGDLRLTGCAGCNAMIPPGACHVVRPRAVEPTPSVDADFGA